ncbi:hypothetical protein PG2010B_0013 [Bifidobacterium animalis subsp. lactis]|nr:hypothetical protein PG2010B_0013 [Bifidobacterium animalis subsp. lactis]RYM95094.1 hypothetical protein PG2007B_0013 [Bifidobacterium animalis subsp. lactis]
MPPESSEVNARTMFPGRPCALFQWEKLMV